MSDDESPASPASAEATCGVEVRLMGRTDVGLVREHNEDSFLIVRLDDGVRDLSDLAAHTLGPRGTLLVVCDGMGGAAAGEVASGMAVDALATHMLEDEMVPAPEGVVDDDRARLARKLRGAAHKANARIYKEARDNLARSGMGTTMTAVQLWQGWALIAQVGDSRAYVWRQGAFTQVTRDQSLVNQLLETGQITTEQARFFEHSNVILQALGVQEEVEVQLSRVELRRDDRLLVCSDGLVGVVSDEEIAAVLGSTDDPAEASRVLIELANGAGGPDNITVIVAHLDGTTLASAGPDEVINFAHWRIDPEPLETRKGYVRNRFEDSDPLPLDPERPLPAPVARLTKSERLSMVAVVGLMLAGLLLGFFWAQAGVRCHIGAARAGLAVMIDGRDSGVRTGAVGVELRLVPGPHTLALRAPDAHLVGEQELEVKAGEPCAVQFAPHLEE